MGQFPYVELVEATAVAVQPRGKESRWNVDGELLADNHLSAQVHIFRLDEGFVILVSFRGPATGICPQES